MSGNELASPRTDAAELPAGRELDAAIHERVMGKNAWTTSYEVGSGEDIVPYFAAPSYTSDIRAAWLVVEKMKADGWGFGFGSEESGWWAAIFANGQHGMAFDGYHEGYSFQPTAPGAICRAALRAVASSEQRDAKESLPHPPDPPRDVT